MLIAKVIFLKLPKQQRGGFPRHALEKKFGKQQTTVSSLRPRRHDPRRRHRNDPRSLGRHIHSNVSNFTTNALGHKSHHRRTDKQSAR
jgi:hypothetical protein